MNIEHDHLCDLIPHSGSMCLLDRVEQWEESRILCLATNHRDPANPLREDGRLPAVAGVEYAAQAMAVHGALLGREGDGPSVGYIAALRNIVFEVERLDDCGPTLRIEASKVMGDARNFIYDFTLFDEQRRLLSGRATVVHP